jgi:RimJ/RimL family protein N-acetyltransferase
VRLRPARGEDLPALQRLALHPSTEAVLAVGSADRLSAAISAEGEQLLVIEVAGQPAGGLRLVLANRRSRIGAIHTLMLEPDLRGRGLAVAALRTLAARELGEGGLHRLEAEVYGFNAGWLRAFARAGFVEEGRRRRAYDRHGAWQDGVLFGLLADDCIDKCR